MAHSLHDCGHSVFTAPMLRIVPLRFDRSILASARAIVVTSANAARAVATAAPAARKIFAVGPDTAVALRRAGVRKIAFAEGTAGNLIDLVTERWQQSDGPVVYASGRDVSVDISEVLRSKGYDSSRVAVYAAKPSQWLDDSTRHLLANGKIDAALFMSVRTAETFVKPVGNSGLVGYCKYLDAVSLSEQIADVLDSILWKESLVAFSPTREGILSEVAIHAERTANNAARPK